MNILFDLIATQPERNLKYHGGSEYAKVLFWTIVLKKQVRICCIYDGTRQLDEDIRKYCTNNSIPLIDIRQNNNLDPIVIRYQIDRFYSPLPFELLIQKTLPLNTNIKTYITIHGLRSLELPIDKFELKYKSSFYSILKYFYKLLFPLTYENKLRLKITGFIKKYNNPTIITVSHYSKWSLKYFIPEIPEKNFYVLYSPFSNYKEEKSDDTFLDVKNLQSKKYFLLLSAGIWQKNSYRLLSAFNKLREKDLINEYKMVIIGASSKIKNTFHESQFVYLDYLERSKLEVLLKNAHALVYPTLNEGFGYPPLEAFKYGTGVIASAIGPVMEVCGNAALYFNPFSLTEMKLRLLESIHEPSFLTQTQQRIDQFSKIKDRQTKDLNTLVDLLCD